MSGPARTDLEWALQHVSGHGFGDLVDADSVIEAAAHAHLAGLGLGAHEASLRAAATVLREKGAPTTAVNLVVMYADLAAKAARSEEGQTSSCAATTTQPVEFVRLGYAGASLHFRVQVSDTEMLWQCLYAAEGYLDVDAVGEAISGAAGLVSSVEFGREFSPVLYLYVPFWTGHAMTAKKQGEPGEQIPETDRETIAARLMAIGESLGAAETDVQLAPADAAPSIANAVICVRLWWD
jgi:hypothetical protein